MKEDPHYLDVNEAEKLKIYTDSPSLKNRENNSQNNNTQILKFSSDFELNLNEIKEFD